MARRSSYIDIKQNNENNYKNVLKIDFNCCIIRIEYFKPNKHL